MWYPRPVKISNGIWDLLFYDFRSLSHHQFYSALDPFVEEGAIIVISPDTELNSNKGFELFASEKVGRDQLDTNRQRAEENVNSLLKQYPRIDTVAIAGCGSSLVGAAAFGKTVAKACEKPVAAIVAGLGMRDLIAQIMWGALFFQPANLAWGVMDQLSRDVQRNLRENVALAPNVIPFSKNSEKLSDIADTFRNTAKNVTNVTERTQDVFKDNALRFADWVSLGEPKSLTELMQHPSWLERAVLAEGNIQGVALDDFVDKIPACAALHELLRRKAQGIVLLVGHSKGAYAINAVAWAMIHGQTDPGIQKAFRETARIVTFGCGARLPDDLDKAKVDQFIGEWDILGNLNTPGVHLPFLPREFSLAPETVDVKWQKRTLHTTSTLNPFSMRVADLLDNLGGGGGGRAEETQSQAA